MSQQRPSSSYWVAELRQAIREGYTPPPGIAKQLASVTTNQEGGGISMTRRMLRRISSRSRPTTRSLAERLADYTTWPEPPLRSRCVVPAPSTSPPETLGGVIGRVRPYCAAPPSYSIVFVEGAVWPWHVVLGNDNAVRCFDRHYDAEMYIERQERLWGEWGWTE